MSVPAIEAVIRQYPVGEPRGVAEAIYSALSLVSKIRDLRQQITDLEDAIVRLQDTCSHPNKPRVCQVCDKELF